MKERQRQFSRDGGPGRRPLAGGQGGDAGERGVNAPSQWRSRLKRVRVEESRGEFGPP
jgi:hypothetical protein